MTPLDVGCPACHAQELQACRHGRTLAVPHAWRARLAVEVFRAVNHLELGPPVKPSELAPLELVPAGALRHALELARARCYRPGK